jgi:hypothetical protein
MKKAVLSLGLLAILFSACKKEQAIDEPKAVNPSDPQSLTAAITIYHSAKISGNVPAPSGTVDAPVLDAGSNNQQIHALNGRYAVIKPSIESGTVAGYYFKITGADFYYKIDFSKPRVAGNRLAGIANTIRPHLFTRSGGMNSNRADSTEPAGYADSSIIIQLPPNIAPGVFCAQYWAYDFQGQVSDSIKVCITVDALGAGADGAGFTGIWKQTKEKYPSNRQDTGWHVISYQKDYMPANSYLCENGQLYQVGDSSGTNPDIQMLSNEYYWVKQTDLNFALNGGVEFSTDYEEGFLDLDNSSCSNIVYRIEGSGAEKSIGGWSYNSSTRQMVLVFDFNGNGTGAPEAFPFTVTEQTPAKFILHKDIDDSWFEFVKK